MAGLNVWKFGGNAIFDFKVVHYWKFQQFILMYRRHNTSQPVLVTLVDIQVNPAERQTLLKSKILWINERT